MNDLRPMLLGVAGSLFALFLWSVPAGAALTLTWNAPGGGEQWLNEDGTPADDLAGFLIACDDGTELRLDDPAARGVTLQTDLPGQTVTCAVTAVDEAGNESPPAAASKTFYAGWVTGPLDRPLYDAAAWPDRQSIGRVPVGVECGELVEDSRGSRAWRRVPGGITLCDNVGP